MKRWARRNLPTVVFLTALLLLAALVILVIEIGKPQTASGTLPRFCHAAGQAGRAI